MVAVGVINKDSIDQAHKNGLVKPNEYETIRDSVIAKELYLRSLELSTKLDLFLRLVVDKEDAIETFYLKQSGYLNTKSAIIHLAYNEPETLLLEQDDISLLILADVAYQRATSVRDLGDINKSKHLDGIILADKDSMRSLDYLIKHKRGLWDLLEYVKEEN